LYLFLDNVVQIGSDFQAEVPDCVAGTVLLICLCILPSNEYVKGRILVQSADRQRWLSSLLALTCHYYHYYYYYYYRCKD